MKGFCYITLIIGFFLFYQQNPIYAVVIIVLFIGVYLFFRSRSSRSKGGVLGFLSGKNTQQDNKIDNLITLMMLQQLVNSSSQNRESQTREEKKEEKEQYLDKIKKEVLDLLEDE
ncbi:MAG: hypothetical protein ACFFDN_15395 [Candidatus Hodarchaeota archaeon]